MRRLVSVPAHSTHCAVCRSKYDTRQKTRCVTYFHPMLWAITLVWIGSGMIASLFAFVNTALERYVVISVFAFTLTTAASIWMLTCYRQGLSVCCLGVKFQRHTVDIRLNDSMLAHAL